MTTHPEDEVHTSYGPVRSVTESARDRHVCALIMTGRSVSEVAEAFHITEDKVVSILSEYRADPTVRTLQGKISTHKQQQQIQIMNKHGGLNSVEEKAKSDRKVEQRVKDTDILDALRAAMNELPSGISMLQGEYNEWRDSHPEAPGTRTIRRRFKWDDAKRIALGSGRQNHSATMITNSDHGLPQVS